MRLKSNKLYKESMKQKVGSLTLNQHNKNGGGRRPKLIKSEMKKRT
jgi:hypothetical protein